MRQWFWIVLTLAGAGSAQAQQTGKISYRDRSVKPERVADVTGTIVEETVNGVKLKPGVGAEREFMVNDIVEVQYDPPTAQVIPYNRIKKLEDDLKKLTGDAAKAKAQEVDKEYRTLDAALKDPKAIALKRHVQLRLAQIKASLAGEVIEQQLEAIEQFDKFRKEHPNCWQLLGVVRQQAGMLMEVNKLDDAAKILEETAKTPKLAKELKQELELVLIDVLIRAGKTADVESKLTEALAILPPNDPLVPRLKVYQLGCQAGKANFDNLVNQLRDIIAKATDPSVVALAYNTLGDCYNSKALKKDAMWAYLWVETVYNQDRVELSKAIDRLARVFKDLGDDARSDRYRDKLKSLR